MSLREEIYETLNTTFISRDKHKDINKLKTDLIVSKIEKRIDYLKLNHSDISSNKDYNLGYTTAVKHFK